MSAAEQFVLFLASFVANRLSAFSGGAGLIPFPMLIFGAAFRRRPGHLQGGHRGARSFEAITIVIGLKLAWDGLGAAL